MLIKIITSTIAISLITLTNISTSEAQLQLEVDTNLGIVSSSEAKQDPLSYNPKRFTESGDTTLGIKIGSSYRFHNETGIGLHLGYTNIIRQPHRTTNKNSTLLHATLPFSIFNIQDKSFFIQAGPEFTLVSFDDPQPGHQPLPMTQINTTWGAMFSLGYEGELIRTGLRTSWLSDLPQNPLFTELFLGFVLK